MSESTPLCGFFNVAKPAEVTSRDVVNTVQRTLRQESSPRVTRKTKVGHAGTLDPMATGVLIVCVGKATKLMPLIHDYSKVYQAGFTLGQTSNTDDSTGQIESHQVSDVPEIAEIKTALATQVGEIMQTPPAFSALKVNGRRAYAAARQGESVELKARPVSVNSIEVIEYQFPKLELNIECGSGTYIRSIARDVGSHLGTGGLMHSLVRTSIGPCKLGDSVQPEQANEETLRPVEDLLTLYPSLELNSSQIESLRYGRKLSLPQPQQGPVRYAALTSSGRFAAQLSFESPGQCRTLINWVPAWYQ